MGAAVIPLMPIQEMTLGYIGAIRNAVINGVVKLASEELSLPPEKLVVRDVRPWSDLQMYAAGTTDSSVDEWVYDATTTTASAFTAVNGGKTMGDQRWVALFGVRDLRRGVGTHTTDMGVDFESTAANAVAMLGPRPKPGHLVSLIKINVGGSDKVIWDVSSIEGYEDCNVGFSPSAVIIPQNATFVIYYYFKTTIAGIRTYLQLVGITVEPRGKVVSP